MQNDQTQNSASPLRYLMEMNASRVAHTVYRAEVLSHWRHRIAQVTGARNLEEEATAVEINVPKDVGIVRIPAPRFEMPREVILQEWEGQIQEVRNDYFTARLVHLTSRETEETEEVELPISDVPDGDRTLVVPGATFRWLIAYRYTQGDKERFTRVTIRRLPAWTDAEIKEADREATELHEAIFGNLRIRTA